ncbi:MAG: PSD1 domain-containing protein [Planctomycetaceae bacterium]|nr:PSD1 domain-containing protein [Planctomycetaceae bacterium]
MKSTFRWLASLAWAVLTISDSGLSPLVAADEERIDFNRDVRPILSNHCFQCHGFDAKQRKADLRLDTAEGALADRGGTFAVKPKDLAGSELWARISSNDAGTVMPPPETKKPLTAAQKETLKKWIEQGATYQKHWAFEPIAKPAVPAVKNSNWARNDVDRFLLARLEKEGLTPRPEADKATLIRRVAFSLTGLPPTPKEVDEYLADKSPEAYEHMVDRYLASPRFGEEMARHWLDVARYADTHGLHLDNERSMWAYRDWVIKAFNQNKPFDAFTREQLAGDLLPNPTQDQLVATGFNRCNVTTSEGGSIEAEFIYRYAVDRTSEVVQTWMGLTGGCAVCHDHKYDPISQREFYSLYAFFHSAADPAMDRNTLLTDPVHKLPTAEQTAGLDAARRTEAAARKALDEGATKSEYVDPASSPDQMLKRHVEETWLDDVFPLNARVTCSSRNSSIWAGTEVAPPQGRRALRQFSASKYQDKWENFTVPHVVPENARLSIMVRIDVNERPKSLMVEFASQRATHRAFWGDPSALGGAKDDKGRIGDVPPSGEWITLELPIDKLDLKPGDNIRSIALAQFGGVCWWDNLKVEGDVTVATDLRSSFSVWWKERTGKDTPGVPGDLAAFLKAGPDQKAADPQGEKQRDINRRKLLAWYLAWIARPSGGELEALQNAWQAANVAVTALDESIPSTFIFKDLDKPRDSFVMLRGQYDKPGEKVEPAVPAILPALKPREGIRPNRLDLAEWLLAPEHPLTARVTVNRFWQQFFGTGLVKTSYDFGSQGETPSHPELLDWLAREFREGRGARGEGQRTEKASTSPASSNPVAPVRTSSHPASAPWDVKALVRLLVTSAAFRQQANVSPELLKRDPENRLYARGPRFRLDAEQIRDNALYVGGLLSLKMGGRGAMSYQPPNIWEPVGYSDSNTRYYLQDHGENLYRRSIYCFLKRTAPPPFMSNFDAPNREAFCTRRERSNTPLQALQLMNDTQHFEAARGFAERILAEGGATPEERITYAWKATLSRLPTGDELAVVKSAFEEYQKRYAADAEAAKRVVGVGESKPGSKAPVAELATWTLIANLILNLDETVTRN